MIGAAGVRCDACATLIEGPRAYEVGLATGEVMTLCRPCAVEVQPGMTAMVDEAADSCPECHPEVESRAARLRRAEATIRHRRGRRVN